MTNQHREKLYFEFLDGTKLTAEVEGTPSSLEALTETIIRAVLDAQGTPVSTDGRRRGGRRGAAARSGKRLAIPHKEGADVVLGETPPLLEAVFKHVEPQSDMEVAAVFAYVAEELGEGGINRRRAAEWAQRVGWPQPANWSNAFSNAGRLDRVRHLGRGLWVASPREQRAIQRRLDRKEVAS